MEAITCAVLDPFCGAITVVEEKLQCISLNMSILKYIYKLIQFHIDFKILLICKIAF